MKDEKSRIAEPLDVATSSYYWKPMAAFFRSLELSVYCKLSVVLEAPVLDLGCGDGRVSQMIRLLGLGKTPLCGVEISSTELRKAKQTKAHLNLIQADGNHLPFKDESFATIVCNGVLCCIPGGVDQALREISRTLKKDGTCVVTVPTDNFFDVLLLPRLLKRVSRRLNRLYVDKLNARLGLTNVYLAGEWAKKLERNSLLVVKSQEFFSGRSGVVWNILAMRVFHIFGLLKFTRSSYVINVTSWFLKRLFRPIYIHDLKTDSTFGYQFLKLRKIAPYLRKPPLSVFFLDDIMNLAYEMYTLDVIL